MAKPISEDEQERILQIVSGITGGAAVDDIHIALGKHIPRRTLQYRLARLVEQGRLRASGKARGRRYHTPGVTLQVDNARHGHTAGEVELEVYIPISKEGQIIRSAISAPAHTRQPVGYQREFLDAYRPNESFYLEDETRQHLQEIGRSTRQQQPAGTYVREIYNRLLIDLSWNSSRLEGNTYSLLETQVLLEAGENAEGKHAMEAQMILNHKAAIEMLVDQAGEIEFDRHTILNLHALLSDNLLEDSAACGRLRTKIVEIGGSVYHPLAVPQLVEECFQQILDTAVSIQDPFEQSFFTMVHLPYLQPFEDVNKRVSRLALNIPFIRENLSPLSFTDVPEQAYVDGILSVYELNRIELLRDVFVWAYERSCKLYSAVTQTLGEPNPLRVKYRAEVFEAVTHVVGKGMNKKQAVSYLRKSIDSMSNRDRQPFMEMIEKELMNLHEGNIARYKIRPSQYQNWKQSWEQLKTQNIR
jgi:hypothetical protein